MELLLLVLSLTSLLICLSVLVVVVKIYKMHDVRGPDGQYAWMMPTSWCKVQEEVIRAQKLIVGSLGELTAHNHQISKLLESQTNATLEMFQELKQIRSRGE